MHSLSDSLHLIYINPDKHAVAMVGIPRDSWVDIPGHGTNKINSALAAGGPDLMVQTVESLLDGISSIDRLQTDPTRIRAHAERFDVRRFGPEMQREIDRIRVMRRG